MNHIGDRTTRRLTTRLIIYEDTQIAMEFDPNWSGGPVEVELGCQKATLSREEARAGRRMLDRYLKATA